MASKTLSVDLSIQAHKAISEIVKRTGEKKVKLFERIIQSEHIRIMNGKAIPADTESKIDDIANAVNEATKATKKTSEDMSFAREAYNKIYCSTLISLKELLRTMHFLSGCVSNGAFVPRDRLSAISNEASKEALESFSLAYKMLSEAKPKEIVQSLLSASKE